VKKVEENRELMGVARVGELAKGLLLTGTDLTLVLQLLRRGTVDYEPPGHLFKYTAPFFCHSWTGLLSFPPTSPSPPFGNRFPDPGRKC
jgi:hypothetical protein